MTFCSECGNRHAADARFCIQCGAPVAQAEPVSAAAPTEAPTPAPDQAQEFVSNQTMAIGRVTDLVAPQRPVSQPVGAPPPMSPPLTGGVARPMPFAGPPPQHSSYGPGPARPPLQQRPSTSPPPQNGGGFDLATVKQQAQAVWADDSQRRLVVRVGIGVAVLVGIVVVFNALSAIAHALGAGGAFVVFFMLAILAFWVGMGAYVYRIHQQESSEQGTLASLPPSVQHVVARLDGTTRVAFFDEYARLRRSTAISYLMMLFVFGTHYFYLRQPLLNVLYWVTGAAGGWWSLFDLFRMRSLVQGANEQAARQCLQTLQVAASFGPQPGMPQPGYPQDR